MGTKQEELQQPQSALSKAGATEPVFVLRAQDKLAPGLVRLWASLAALHGCNVDKVGEAKRLAADMEAWQYTTRRAKWPD